MCQLKEDQDEESETIALNFEVWDTGCGMEEKEIQQLFTPFYAFLRVI
jgi:signal transduction histidine kinase